MEIDYHNLRAFADSWGLVYMMAIFAFVIYWAFRPGSKRLGDDAAQIPFKED